MFAWGHGPMGATAAGRVRPPVWYGRLFYSRGAVGKGLAMNAGLRLALKNLILRGGALAKPPGGGAIERANAELAAHGCAALPSDYAVLLKGANGVSCNRLLLYPLGSRAEAFSLVGATIKERKAANLEPCHVVGHVHHDLQRVVRDCGSGQYRFYDDTDSLLWQYASLARMLDELSMFGVERR